MQAKGLFDAMPEPEESPFEGEPVFMAAVKDEARRTAAWMETKFGPVTYLHQSFHHLKCCVYGVTVHARLWAESQTVDWSTSFGGKGDRAGCTVFGANLDATVPSGVRMAAEIVRLNGGTGL